MIAQLRTSLEQFLEILPPETRKAWFWDMITGICAGIYQGSIWTFVARVARADLRAGVSEMSWIAAAPALGYLFATLWARQMEGRSKMPFVVWTWLFSRGIFLLAPFVTSLWQFILIVCITPIIFSISAPAYVAIMKEVYPDAHRGRLMSAVRIGLYAMTLVSSLVMGRLLDHGLHWRVAFGIGGVFGVISALTFWRIPLNETKGATLPTSTQDFFTDTLGILRRNRGFRWFLGSVFVSGFGNIISATLIPIHQVDYFHISNTQVANMQNVTAIATIISFLFWGTFLDRRGPLLAVLVALGFNLAIPLTYYYAQNITTLYIAAACTGLTMSGIELAYVNTILMFAEPGKVAQYQALHSSFFGVRGSIAPHCAIPLMKNYGARSAFFISFLVLFLGAVLQAVSMRHYRKKD